MKRLINKKKKKKRKFKQLFLDPINKAYFCYKRKRILYPTLSTKNWHKYIVFKILSLGGKNTPSSIVTLENISFLKGMVHTVYCQVIVLITEAAETGWSFGNNSNSSPP